MYKLKEAIELLKKKKMLHFEGIIQHSNLKFL